MKQKAWMKQLVSAALTVAMAVTLFPADAKTMEVKAETALAKPSVVKDSGMQAGQKVTWDCVWFGSYPQAEVITKEMSENYTSVDSSFLNTEDVIVSDRVYNVLEKEDGWDDNNDLTFNGVKYHRMLKKDAAYSTADGNHYRWSDSDTYHYFQYEPIKWRVLAVSGGQALLLADVALDVQRYNMVYGNVTWETSTIRSWLNGYEASSNQQDIDYSGQNNFINNAFALPEQSAIVNTKIVNASNIEDPNGKGGNDTTDKIFLLSESEVYDTATAASYGFVLSGSTYDEARRCTSSTYAKARGTYSSTDRGYEGNCYWWLRSPGNRSYLAASVFYNGCINSYGGSVDGRDVNVRPALTLNLAVSDLYSYAGTVCSDGTMNEVGNVSSGANGSILDIDIDEYLIGEVKKYTSDKQYAQFDAVMSAETSTEEKFCRLNELFCSNGITDIKEGIQYLSEADAYGRNYLYLTTDESYCAFNFYHWLKSVSGAEQKDLLYENGLIFSSEVRSDTDLSTYTENDFPGVKEHRAMLEQFIGQNSSNSVQDVLDYANKTAKYFSNVIELNHLEVTENANEIMNKIIHCTSETELQELQEEFVNGYVIPQAEALGTNTVYLGCSWISEALNGASDILEFEDASAEDIIGVMNLCNELAMYQKYSRFLRTVYQNTDVSFEMRLAAYQLLNDVNNGYYNKITDMISNCITPGTDFMHTDQSVFQACFGVNGRIFDETSGTINLAVYISNVAIEVKEFVKQAAYTQGYAELSALYSLKLEKDKESFQIDPSAENAWTFFEDYTVLWNLRYQGEEQYRQMSDIKTYLDPLVNTFRYNLKQEMADSNLGRLDKCKFEVSADSEIPASVRYEKKAVICCPGDVSVYTKDGKLVAELKDGMESDMTNDYGRFAAVYQPYTGEYTKVICQSTSESLTIRLTAVSEGLADFRILEQNTMLVFDKLKMEQGNVVDISEDSYYMDYEGDGSVDVSGTLTDRDCNSYIKVESASAEPDTLELICGEKKFVSITIEPYNATNTTADWISLDENIAAVKNGAVTGVAAGKTTILARVVDAEDLVLEIPVVISEKQEVQDQQNQGEQKQPEQIQEEKIPEVVLSKPLLKKAVNKTSGISISWKKVTGASGYYIYRKNGNGNWKKIATIKSGSTLTYTDKAVKTKNARTYSYTVSAYSGNVTSTYNKTGKKLIRLTTPKLLKPVNKADGRIMVKWKANAKTTGYQVQYSTSAGFKNAKKTAVKKRKTTNVVLKLKKNKKYYIRIRCYKKVGKSTYYSAWSPKRVIKTKK